MLVRVHACGVRARRHVCMSEREGVGHFEDACAGHDVCIFMCGLCVCVCVRARARSLF